MSENEKPASVLDGDGKLTSVLDGDGKLTSAMDHIDDRYLAEVAQYDMTSGKMTFDQKTIGKMTSDKKAFGMKDSDEKSFAKTTTVKRRLIRQVAIAACACLLLVVGGIVWKTKWSSNGSTQNPDTAKEMTEGTIYIDAHTFLSGREGENPMEIKVSAREGQNADEAKEEAAAPTFITLTWAYESFGGPEEVSRATVRELNRKLKEDGYHLGIKFLPIKTSLTGGTDDVQEYYEKLMQSKADIAFTGFYSRNGHFVQDAIREGKFEPLDRYLADSQYYDLIPEILWETVKYQGQTYFFPNEIAQDGGLKLYLRKSSFTQEEADDFDGDLFSLEKWLADGKRLLDCSGGYVFAETFGYSYYNGVLLTEAGSAVNPLEEEQCVRWLRLLNQYKKQVLKNNTYDWDFALSRSFPATGIGEGNQPEDFYVYSWKGYAAPRLNCQTGILASSANKDAAFAFLDLLRSDRSYAELLLYGKEYLDGKGESQCCYANQLTFGLDTGLVLNTRDHSLRHFSTAEEKIQYYAENILPSPALMLRHPEACDAMLPAEDYYPRLTFTNDFDELLEEARKKLAAPMKKVLQELSIK